MRRSCVIRSAVGRGVRRGRCRHGDVLDELDAAQLLHHRRVRDVDQVILILAHAGLALARHHADHREWLVVDADDLADRIHVGAKQLFVHDGAEHRDLGCGRDIHRRKEGAVGRRPRSNQRQIDIGALHLRAPVHVAGDDLAARVDAGRDVLHAGQIADRRRVIRRQRARIALAHAHAALLKVAGAHHDHVGARGLDLRLDR